MELDSVRDDLLVAGVAAGCAVALTVTLVVVAHVAVPVWLRAAPIVVYFAYLFSRKGGPYGSFDTPRNWAALTVAVTLLAAALAVFR